MRSFDFNVKRVEHSIESAEKSEREKSEFEDKSQTKIEIPMAEIKK